MSTESHRGTPLPLGAAVRPGTLRAELEHRRERGEAMSLAEAVGVLVPLAVELAVRHQNGEQLYLHPSSIVRDEARVWTVSSDYAVLRPVLPRDKACMAPEEREGRPGNAAASVFALGAILYELVTGTSVGPGMRRPRELVPGLPEGLEVVLSKALVTDPRHRPDDLNALAQAVHHLEPSGSIAPPRGDEAELDHAGELEVDVSLSMMPPAPGPAPTEASSPYDMVVRQEAMVEVALDDQTSTLAALKARLEADPRPRYAVVKDGMDHGPFNAVELLQQLASNTFVDSDVLRDSFSKEEKPISQWDEFAPFAKHAAIHRNIRAEKEALERSVIQESRSTRGKAVLGVVAVGLVLAGATAWFLTQRGTKDDRIAVQGDSVTSIETDAGLKVPKKRGGSRGGVIGRQGGYPVLGGGMSCEAAQAKYVEEINVGGPRGQADITRAQYAAVLNRGGYFSHCGVPESMGVSICAAVQNGRAVGVTVVTKPGNPGVQGCIANSVRRISFPAHPKLDVTRTHFAPAG